MIAPNKPITAPAGDLVNILKMQPFYPADAETDYRIALDTLPAICTATISRTSGEETACIPLEDFETSVGQRVMRQMRRPP